MSKPVLLEIGKRYKFCISSGCLWNISNDISIIIVCFNVTNPLIKIMNESVVDRYFLGTIESIRKNKNIIKIFLSELEYL